MKNQAIIKLNSRMINKSPVHYGWVILVVGTLGIIMSSPGQTYSFSIFIEEFIRDLEISRTMVSGVYAVGTVVGNLALPYVGQAIDRRGNRTMVVLIAIGFGSFCFYMSFVQNIWMLMIGIVFMRMLGQSGMVLVSQNVINQWWVERRGLILGVAILVSATLGAGMFPNLINWLIPQVGWRSAYWVLGLMVIGLMVPVGILFYRERPELYGLLPDGHHTSTARSTDAAIDSLKQAEASNPPSTTTEENWTRSEAIRTPAFWLISLSISMFAMLVTGLTFHIVSIFADNGLSADLAAAIFLPIALTTSSMSIPLGWLSDRIKVKYMLAMGLILLTITILSSTSIAGPRWAIAYGIVFGLTNAFARIVGGVAYANYFGRTHLGSITGLASTIGAVMSGLGPLIYGAGRDIAGSYWPALLISAFLPGTMAIAVLMMKKPTKGSVENRTANVA